MLFITSVNATALYNTTATDEEPAHLVPVGHIQYDLPFAVPAADPETGRGVDTPRLPVDWSLGSVGYEAVRKAVGGTLKLSAKAEVDISIEKWMLGVWYEGHGLGVSVRL
jgi:hypothetical protein